MKMANMVSVIDFAATAVSFLCLLTAVYASIKVIVYCTVCSNV